MLKLSYMCIKKVLLLSENSDNCRQRTAYVEKVETVVRHRTVKVLRYSSQERLVVSPNRAFSTMFCPTPPPPHQVCWFNIENRILFSGLIYSSVLILSVFALCYLFFKFEKRATSPNKESCLAWPCMQVTQNVWQYHGFPRTGKKAGTCYWFFYWFSSYL